MDQLFWIQSIVAFFVGGLAISFLTIAAEKAPSNLSGIILALPTNMVIGLFFLALVNTPQIIVENIAGVPLTLAGAILYVVAYLLAALYIFTNPKIPKALVILLCIVCALLAWLFFPLVILAFGTPSLLLGLLIFAVVVAFMQYLLIQLARQKSKAEPAPKVLVTAPTILFRAALAGGVIVTALVVSKTLGPFWGVVVGSSFPAAYTATLIALHLNSDATSLLSITKMLPLGTSGQMFYVLMLAITYDYYNLWFGTLVAYLLTVVYYLFLAQVKRFMAV